VPTRVVDRKSMLRIHLSLSRSEIRRLTLFKWRYTLESAGLTSEQADHLLFLKWAYANGRIAP
jgi:hypothetical protein